MSEDGQFETTAVERLDGDMFKIGLTINFIDAERAAFDFAVGIIIFLNIRLRSILQKVLKQHIA